ncbi:peptidoglycan-binding protein [Streptomyces sp. NPDC088725]|uniref:peptidoglycan-binding protein n=1 Tax=Streptomyces sp. NPDC088725 TaxID=3365873 RepID=UPI00381812BF
MRWKELRGSLDPTGRQLVVRLRRLKDHSGLSLTSLQAKTPFSVSSWERYLNGKALPPAAAVEALTQLADADPAPILALRDAAEQTWTAAAKAEGVAAGCERQPGEPKIRVGFLSAAAAALLVSAVTSIWLVSTPGRPHTPADGRGAGGVGRYTCVYTRRDDVLFAGNSSTVSRLVLLNSTGPDAAEVQCLLLRHELSPGDTDGYYGKRTEAQVKLLQQRGHMTADGIVGEQTWALLRHVE